MMRSKASTPYLEGCDKSSLPDPHSRFSNRSLRDIRNAPIRGNSLLYEWDTRYGNEERRRKWRASWELLVATKGLFKSRLFTRFSIERRWNPRPRPIGSIGIPFQDPSSFLSSISPPAMILPLRFVKFNAKPAVFKRKIDWFFY